jgi:pimeloyl-ACP methyl ester carboxylesterase
MSDETSLPDGFESITVSANGTRLHAVVGGSGEPVLLLHGWPQTWRVWRHVMPALAAHGYRVVAPDLRGTGASDPSHGGVRIVGHDIGAWMYHVSVTLWAVTQLGARDVSEPADIEFGAPSSHVRPLPGVLYQGVPLTRHRDAIIRARTGHRLPDHRRPQPRRRPVRGRGGAWSGNARATTSPGCAALACTLRTAPSTRAPTT